MPGTSSASGSRTGCVLPDFRTAPTDASGIVENELCPVYLAATQEQPVPPPDEVMELRWVDPSHVRQLVELAPYLVSPWMVLQVKALPTLRQDPTEALR